MKEDFKYALPVGTILRSPNREYRIEQVLGVGGFGITYKVSATLVYKGVPIFTHFALKEHFLQDACERATDTAEVVCSKPSKARVEESRQDFLSEARRLNALSGQTPGIVPVSEVFEANGTAYYVMEFLGGGSLRDIVKAGGPMTEAAALGVFEPVAQAVAFLHRNRINHLDLKPDNIMFKQTPGGELKPVIIDFGLSKHYDQQGRPTSTVRIQGCSDGYAPVEQYAGLNSFAPQADVYALGATLYYMLVGKDPVIATEQTSAALMAALPSAVSRAVKNAIIGAMQQNRADRLPSVEAFLAALHDDEAAPVPTDDPMATRVIGEDGDRRRKTLWIVLGCVAVALIGGGVAAYMLLSGNRGIGLRDGEYEYLDEFPQEYAAYADSAPVETAAVYDDEIYADTAPDIEDGRGGFEDYDYADSAAAY